MNEEPYEDLCVIDSETEQDAELDDETFGESARDGTILAGEFVNLAQIMILYNIAEYWNRNTPNLEAR